MNNITDINEFRAKKMFRDIDYRRVAVALIEVEDQILKLEQEDEEREENKHE